jgi:hypothetical protein
MHALTASLVWLITAETKDADMADKKAPANGTTRPDGDRSPYEKSAQEHKAIAYPKTSGGLKGRGGYPPCTYNSTSGGYKK